MVFAEGACEGPPAPAQRRRCTTGRDPAPYAVVCNAFPRNPARCPTLPPTAQMPDS